MKLPKLKDLNVKGKKVIVRMDLDVAASSSRTDDVYCNHRLNAGIPTLLHLIKHQAEIVIIGHRGRPGGKVNDSLSLKPISKLVEGLLEKELGGKKMKSIDLEIMENLRFNGGEEKNSLDFAKHLSELGEIYINEAFSASHRNHASIVGLPQQIKISHKGSVAVGFRFAEEVENLSRVLDSPKKPVVVVVGGVKEDKLSYLPSFEKFADRILVGGRLPLYLNKEQISIRVDDGEKVVVGELNQDKEDITVHTIERFEKEIKKAKTIVVAGPMGHFEEEGQSLGTRRVFEAVISAHAYKVLGGGESTRAARFFGLTGRFDWVSVGGGAMLEFLTKGTLPGIEALLN